MLRHILCLSILISISSVLHAQSKVSIEGEWLVADLDNSTVIFYKGKDEYWYSKILKSDNAVYLNQVIYKGKFNHDNSFLEGIFTTPKSKMNINTKVYLDNAHQMRFVGKKFFITKTYIGKRVK